MHDQEEVGPGVFKSWHNDQTILLITVNCVSRVAVDVFVDLLVQTLVEWPEDRPYLCVQAFAENITVTPYLRERLADVLQVNRADIYGKSAIVTRNMATYAIFDMMFRTIDNIFPRMEKRTFADLDCALAWLNNDHNG